MRMQRICDKAHVVLQKSNISLNNQHILLKLILFLLASGESNVLETSTIFAPTPMDIFLDL